MPWKQKRKTEYNRVVYTTNVCFVRTFFEMDPFPNVPAYQKAELNQFIDEQQLKDSTRMFNALVEECFDKCVTNFGSKTLTDKESKCMKHCTEKMFKVTQRVGMRFSENRAEQFQLQKLKEGSS